MQGIPMGAINNPFFAASSAGAFSAPAIAADDAPEGSYAYVLVPSAPEVPAEECETTAETIELRVLWGTSVLNVLHLTPPRSFYVGDAGTCDMTLPADQIGASRMPVVLVGSDGAAYVVVPSGATGTLALEGQRAMSLADAETAGLLQPCSEHAGARQAALPRGAKAKVTVGNFTFEIGSAQAGRVVAGHLSIDERALPFQGLSVAIHVGLLAAMALFMPPLAMAEEDGSRTDQAYAIAQMLATTAEAERDDKPSDQVSDKNPDDHEGGQGTRAKFEEGKMGSMTSRDVNKRWGIAGSPNEDPRLAKTRAIEDAQNFGMVGLLNTLTGGDPKAPTAPWGGDVSVGRDAISANGNMWGQEIGEAAGANGLGLAGVGEGGGGLGEGIGVGKLGFGHGGCVTGPCGDGDGFGKGHGFLRKGHKPEGIRMRQGESITSGHLPPEIIQRVVRMNFGRFRLCYENGLRSQPNLQGRVSIRFIIGRDGSVSSAGNGGSDMPDSGVVNCVARAFYGLSFPAPESGIVTVTYPIMFTPGA